MLADFKFHHIGYAVRCIEDSATMYLNENWSLSNAIVDPIQNVRIAFLKREGMPLIEFVEPIDKSSPVNNTLEKNGVAPYHICYEVNNMETALKQLRKLRFMPLFKPVPAAALDNRLICYLYNSDVGLIEIVE